MSFDAAAEIYLLKRDYDHVLHEIWGLKKVVARLEPKLIEVSRLMDEIKILLENDPGEP